MIGKVELQNIKDCYLVRKDQRHQGRNPQRKQEKVEVKIGKVELQNMKDSYLIRKDQRYQSRNPQRKQEKVVVSRHRVRKYQRYPARDL